MKYREFKEKIECWGQKHGYVTEVGINDESQTYVKVEFNGKFHFYIHISNEYRCVLDTNWKYFKETEENARAEVFDILVELAKTPPIDREDRKRFIIPLPGLVTTDGKQQYLTYKDGKFFASRRDEALIQTWKEDQLDSVLNIYRQCAVEIEEKEH